MLIPDSAIPAAILVILLALVSPVRAQTTGATVQRQTPGNSPPSETQRAREPVKQDKRSGEQFEGNASHRGDGRPDGGHKVNPEARTAGDKANETKSGRGTP